MVQRLVESKERSPLPLPDASDAMDEIASKPSIDSKGKTASDLEVLQAAVAAKAARASGAKKAKKKVVIKIDEKSDDSDETASDNDGDQDPARGSVDEEVLETEVDADLIVETLYMLRLKHRNSAMTWWVETKWKNPRNKHECHALAEMVDAYRKDHAGEVTRTLGLLLKRMNGVHLADATGKWEMCAALQGEIVENSLLGAKRLRKVQKTAAANAKLNSSSSKSFSTKSSARATSPERSSGFSYTSANKGGNNKGKAKKSTANKNNAKSRSRSKSPAASSGPSSGPVAADDDGAGASP
jgi:hypothetical protein